MQKERNEEIIESLTCIEDIGGISESGNCVQKCYLKTPPLIIETGNHPVSNSLFKWNAIKNRFGLENSPDSGGEDKPFQYDNSHSLTPLYLKSRVICDETIQRPFTKGGSRCERNNNSNQSDITPPRATDSDIYRDCQYSGRIIRVEGDGRCLFRSLVTCRCAELQKAMRDEFGCPIRHEEAILETQMADELRQQVVKLMNENAHFYTHLGKDIINADQPANQPEEYGQFGERLDAMNFPSTMAGDLELNATSSVLEGRILVLDVNLRCIFLYGNDRFPESPVYAVRYTRLGPDVGHFDAVILDLPLDHLIDQFETQKIDHLQPDQDTSLHGFGDLSIKDTLQEGPAQGVIYANSHDKSCQTQSNVTLVSKDEPPNDKEMDMEDSDGPEGSPVAEEGMPSEDIKEEAHKQKSETVCAHWKSLISSLSGRGRDVSLPNLAQSGATNKVPVTRKLATNQVPKTTPKRGGQTDQASRKSFPANTRKAREEKTFSPSQLQSTKTCKQVIKNHPVSRKRRHSTCREQNRGSGEHVCGSEAGRNKHKVAPAYKRKIQDCNENHYTGKSRKRKLCRSEENITKPSDKKSSCPSSLSQTAKRRKCSAKDGSVSAKPIKGPPESLQTVKKARCIGRDGFALNSPGPVSPPHLPLISLKTTKRCFICLKAVPLSRPLYVRCVLCFKVAHRPCVRNYLHRQLDEKKDEYFLCQRCTPL